MKTLLMPLRVAALLAQCTRLACTQVWLHKTKAALTTAGILIGIAATLGVTAGLLGFRGKVLSELEQAGAKAIYLSPRRPESGPEKTATEWDLRFLPEHIEGLKDKCPSVASVVRRVWVPGGARCGARYTDEVDIYGMSREFTRAIGMQLTVGRPITADDQANRRYVCVISDGAAEALNLGPDPVGEEIVMLGRTWRIVGVARALFKGSFVSFDDDTPNIYVPFETVYTRDARIYVTVIASGPRAVGDAVAEATFFLRRTRGIAVGEPDDFLVMSTREVTEMFESRAAAITMVAAAVVSVSLLVGGIGIMNIMLVSVTERTREIGLRKAVGASAGAVMLQFLVEAVVVCLLGGLLGVAFGETLAFGLRCIPGGMLSMAHVPLWAVALAFSVCTAVGIFFGMFPAVKAARLDPIEALRHE